MTKWKVVATRVLIVAGLAAWPGGVDAHDTGHHSDLTRDALQEAGFTRDATRIVQVTNWLTDFFSNEPLAPVNPTLQAVRDQVDKLHFDRHGDRLGDYASLKRYWDHLTRNTHAAVQEAASNGDDLRVLAILGLTLHAVQDFYSHTTWVETHPRAAGAPLRSDTWFAALPSGPVAGLKSGRYPNSNDANPAPDDHGGYHGPGINHDSYVRPNWLEGTVSPMRRRCNGSRP